MTEKTKPTPETMKPKRRIARKRYEPVLWKTIKQPLSPRKMFGK